MAEKVYTQQQVDAQDLARRFHEAYERLASSFGYETRRESAVPWESVPENNRKLMIAVCAELISVSQFAGPQEEERDCRLVAEARLEEAEWWARNKKLSENESRRLAEHRAAVQEGKDAL